jgi:transposase
VAQNFLPCDRDQELLLPPSLREWLPEDHLAWFVLETVGELELEPFYAAYRGDGWGAAAHDPEMMVALLVYAYAGGVRSARGIERRCRDDVAFRVITANQVPDHATIARFRARHEGAISKLFGGVLELCAKAGLVRVGIVAVDGTKIAAAATHHATRSFEQIAAEILAEAPERMRRRMSSMARRAVTSCPKGCAPAAIGASGCARPSRRSRPSVQRGPSRSRATADSVSLSASAGSRRSGNSSGA